MHVSVYNIKIADVIKIILGKVNVNFSITPFKKALTKVRANEQLGT